MRRVFFRENITYLMARDGLSAHALADKVGISYSVINYYKRGLTLPNLFTLTLLGDFFRISLDDLVYKDLEAEAAK